MKSTDNTLVASLAIELHEYLSPHAPDGPEETDAAGLCTGCVVLARYIIRHCKTLDVLVERAVGLAKEIEAWDSTED